MRQAGYARGHGAKKGKKLRSGGGGEQSSGNAGLVEGGSLFIV